MYFVYINSDESFLSFVGKKYVRSILWTEYCNSGAKYFESNEIASSIEINEAEQTVYVISDSHNLFYFAAGVLKSDRSLNSPL